MVRRTLFGNRSQIHRSSRSRASVHSAARLAFCEALEPRQLLTQFTFNVPQNEGFTAVYLQQAGPDGWVNVLKNSATGTVVHEFRGDSQNGTGMYIVDAGSLSNFLFVDQVAGADKPTATPGTPTDNGIRVQASTGAGGHLKIEAGANDDLLRVTQSTSTSATVEARTGYASFDFGNSRFGAGVNKLTIQTHSNGNAQVRVTTRERQDHGGPPVSDLPELASATALRIESLGAHDQIHLGGTYDASVHAVVRTGVGANEVHLNQNKFITGKTTTAIVDFDLNLGGGLQSGHVLLVGAGADTGVNCEATLARASGTGPHVINVGLVEVNNHNTYGILSGPYFPATLRVAEQTAIGELKVFEDELNFAGHPRAFVEARLDVVNSASTTGRAFVNGRMDFADTSAPSTVHEFALNASLINTKGVVNVNQGADVTALTTSMIGALNIGEDAKLTLRPRTAAPSQPNARVLSVRSLHIDKTPSAPLGQLDLKDNSMIVDYLEGTTSPIADVQSLITSAYAGGAWTADGITSSTAAAVAADTGNLHKTGVGYAEMTNLFSTSTATWDGQEVNDSSVLVKYTYYGDANLDGMVNLADFNRVASNFGQSPRRWSQGDFNYDTVINLADFNRLASNFGQFGLGSGDPGDIEEVTQEELEDMWEQETNGG